MAIDAWLTGGLTALLAEARQGLGASAARARARRAGGVTIYPLTLAGRLVFDAAILLMAGLAALVLYHGDDWRVAALLAAFVALCVFAYPGDVVVDPAVGVRTRRWYTQPIVIGWHDVAELKTGDQLGQSTVVSVSGRTIVHTSLHADREGFCRDVRRYGPPSGAGAPRRPSRQLWPRRSLQSSSDDWRTFQSRSPD